MKPATYYEFNDGWFTYFVNVETGAKKFRLSKKDRLVDHKLDDFSRSGANIEN